jgi:hypothetical protein
VGPLRDDLSAAHRLGGGVVSLPVALEPGVDCRHTDARQLRDLADGVPLGHLPHGLHELEAILVQHAL